MVYNQIEYEAELVEELWSHGWAAFRTNSQAPGVLANCDVIAMKDGRVYVLNVVVMENATSKKTVFDENKEMKKIRRRAKTSTLDQKDGMNFGHAVKKIYQDSWEFVDHHTDRISNSQDLPRFHEALE